ncbi:hypothetical protein Q5O89_12520 [Peribacillus frigoritolerans]|nr:hypothetical protein [Peribacillus frigoritolerans]
MSKTADDNKRPKDNQARNAEKISHIRKTLLQVSTPIRRKRTINEAWGLSPLFYIV